MIVVALALVAALAATVALSAQALARQARQHARERHLLLNQMCALAGRPWEQPPATMTNLGEREWDGIVPNVDQWDGLVDLEQAR